MENGLELYAEMQQRAEKLQETMKHEKQRQGKTNQQMIDESGVARSTVNNYFAGVLGSLGLVQAAALCRVLGIGLDWPMGLTDTQEEDKQAEIDRLRAELDHKEELIQILDGGVKARRPLIYGLLGLCALLGMALMMYIILDAQRPDVGLIRAGGVSPILLVICFAGVCGGLWTAYRAASDRIRRKKKE